MSNTEIWEIAQRRLPGWVYASLRHIVVEKERPWEDADEAEFEDMTDDEIGGSLLRLDRLYGKEKNKKYLKPASRLVGQLKRRGITGHDKLEIVRDCGAASGKKDEIYKGVPSADVAPSDKKAAQVARSEKYGIKAQMDGANLSYPSGNPTKEALYGDPVNLHYPFGGDNDQPDPVRLRSALQRFKQFGASGYPDKESRALVYERIVRAATAAGITVAYNADDPIDALLPESLVRSLVEKSDTPYVMISKSEPVKRIVYGVVLDPYGPNGAKADAHNDYVPPSAIEETAHAFMRGHRVIGMQHLSKADAVLVESSIEQYPSQDDYRKAMKGEPHRVYRRPFGDDFVHSGSWVVGVQLGEKEWAAYENKEINAFSPGGIGVRRSITKDEMPKVEFIDLVFGG
jgi:hypothetical protein